MNEFGSLENFNHQAFIDAALELVRGDDVLMALELLEKLPSFYRDFPPKEILDIKNLILSRIATPLFYSKEELNFDFCEDSTQVKNVLRAQLLLQDVKALNQQHLSPHIVDWGPGNFWVPRLLFEEGCFFTYKPVCLTRESKKVFFDNYPHFQGEPEKDDPKVFFACELIEHLQNEADIKTVMLQECGPADLVHISTPRYTFDGRDLDHSPEGIREALGHLRSYTPNEFVQIVGRHFKEYTWQFYESQIMHLRLERKK